MEALVDKLNSYSKYGIPQIVNKNTEDIEESLYKLEDDWKEIVTLNKDLTESERQQQTAVWELVQTEVAYIHTLKLVTDLFLCCLMDLKKAGILVDVDKRRLLSNVEEICDCNIALWSRHFLPMLASAREAASTLDPRLLVDAFVKCEETFAPYISYCSEQSECQKYCREKTQSNELFTAYLVWCETQKDCRRRRLVEMLIKPMQRLTKYSLLLKAILRHTTNDTQRLALDIMIERMDSFVNTVNSAVRQKEDVEGLKSVITRIETYEPIDTKDEDLDKLTKRHCELDLTAPMPGCNPCHKRQLVAEADFKLKDANSSKMEVHCIVLTDMLLVCKAVRGNQLKVIRPPYPIGRVVVQELNRDTPTLAILCLSEYQTAASAFLLTSSDLSAIKSFELAIKRASSLYNNAKQASDDSCKIEFDSNSYSGSVELVEGCSPGSNVSVSRGLSVETELRPSSHSSDEALAHSGAVAASGSDRLRVEVPTHGQSLPDLKEAGRRWLAPPRPLVPPPIPPRGASYPPPSPPLRRVPAVRHYTVDQQPQDQP